MLISKHDLRRSDLLHRELRQPSLDGRQFIMVAAAATAAGDLLRYWQGIRIWRRSDQCNGLVWFNLLHCLMAKSRATQQ
jgi:hypothetical protein